MEGSAEGHGAVDTATHGGCPPSTNGLRDGKMALECPHTMVAIEPRICPYMAT